MVCAQQGKGLGPTCCSRSSNRVQKRYAYWRQTYSTATRRRPRETLIYSKTQLLTLINQGLQSVAGTKNRINQRLPRCGI
ncbi:hypothetical protein CX658_18905 [Pseudomonas amygdali pv. lachrymans]|nr:hypothetical protein CX658_18905 [Pseudomonas amygdali pv. lachrymans]